MGAIISIVLLLGLFVGPLAARVVFDRRADRAAVVAADLRAAIRRRLGGESLVSVYVSSPSFGRPGSVLLSVPAGYGSLIEEVWPVVAERLPADHDLVVRPGSIRPLRAAAPVQRLPRAA